MSARERNILGYGFDTASFGVPSATLLHDQTFLGRDLILIRVGTLFHHNLLQDTALSYRGDAIHSWLSKLEEKVQQAIEHKIPVVFVLSDPTSLLVQYVETHEFHEITSHFESLLGVRFRREVGPAVQPVHDDFKEIANASKSFSHTIVLEGDSSFVPGLVIPGTVQAVGGFVLRGNDNADAHILLPENAKYNEILGSVCALADKVGKSAGSLISSPEIPTWTNVWLPNEEVMVREEIQSIAAQREALEVRFSEVALSRDSLARRRLLFSATGAPLEKVVEEAFEGLGYVKQPLRSEMRVDRIFSADERDIVCEIKGVSKSAAEKHLSQLMKWCGEYLEFNGREPDKALLVINPFKDQIDTPDGEVAYPENVLKTAHRHEYGIVTGLQLFCAWYDVERGNVDAKEIRDELGQLVGVWDRYQNWTDFIEIVEPLECYD